MSRSVGTDRSYRRKLGALLGLGALVRLAYVAVQRRTDPLWDAPMLDGTIYLAWAERIGWGSWGIDGAFYLAPLYPLLLALLHATVGDDPFWLFAVQQLLVVTAAGLGAVVARRVAGDLAGLAAAALLLFHQPWIFFASKSAAEALALVLAFAALAALPPSPKDWTWRNAALAGILAGLAVLARPNLLLLPLAWSAWAAFRGRWRPAAILLAALTATLLPIGLRNLAASGHFVPVSSNAGITAYHGNGPGASGIFTTPAGMTGSPATQREEATALARRASRRPEMDAVEADRWWGKKALEARRADPAGTLKLFATKFWYTLGSHEIGLDEHPSFDRNALRATFRQPGGELPLIPFGLLLGLTIAGLVLGSSRSWGGALVALSLLACAATPLLFYMSCRYRLPLAAFLTISAGCGLAALVQRYRSGSRADVWPALLLALSVTALSLFSPGPELRRLQTGTAHGNAAAALQRAGELELAQSHAEIAVRMNPDTPVPWFNLGRILQLQGDRAAAVRMYNEALSRDPAFVAAHRNLAAIWLEAGQWDEAIGVSLDGLMYNPQDEACHTHRVVALALKGDRAGAEAALQQAAAVGVRLDPQILEDAWAAREGREE